MINNALFLPSEGDKDADKLHVQLSGAFYVIGPQPLHTPAETVRTVDQVFVTEPVSAEDNEYVQAAYVAGKLVSAVSFTSGGVFTCITIDTAVSKPAPAPATAVKGKGKEPKTTAADDIAAALKIVDKK